MENANMFASFFIGSGILIVLFITWLKLNSPRLGKYGILTGLFSISILALPLWEIYLTEQRLKTNVEPPDYQVQLARSGNPFLAPQFKNQSQEKQNSQSIESNRKSDIELWSQLLGIEYDTMEGIFAMGN